MHVENTDYGKVVIYKHINLFLENITKIIVHSIATRHLNLSKAEYSTRDTWDLICSAWLLAIMDQITNYRSSSFLGTRMINVWSGVRLPCG